MAAKRPVDVDVLQQVADGARRFQRLLVAHTVYRDHRDPLAPGG
jgi:hypothetical protein